jgi:signal transduction histidine kinase
MAFVPPDNSENKLASLLAENADLRARLVTVEAAQNNPLRTINHELRTLISLILGPAELLLQQVSLTQDVRLALEMVTRNALLLLKLVNDLLEISHKATTGTNRQSEEDPAPKEPTDAHMSQVVVKELLPVRPLSSTSSSFSSNSVTSEQSLILIVEDHPQMRQFLLTQLSSRYCVVEATNGQEGLKLAQQMHPDLILTDIMMPIMSGNEMLAALRADSSCDDIIVVVLSAEGNDDLRLNLLREGAQDYLIKPFSSEELQVRLGNLLTLQRTRRLLQEELSSSQQNIESLVHVLTTSRRDLEAMNSELRSMNKQQSNFVAVVSHEFRTALSGIQGFSELLSEQEWSSQEVKEYAMDITADARRLSRLINEVLDLERMKSGKTTLLDDLVDVNALLRKLGDQTQHMAAKHTLVYHLDDALPFVQGNQDQLIQVVGNILSNALKYSPAGGNILLSSQGEQDSIHISIQDQGIGIAEEALKTIFEPYSRIDLEKTRFIGGTGLGLSLVREIINLHGGTILVESTPGSGSTFHFFLPLIRAVSGVSSEHSTSSNI